jgi:hypothetical protein
MRKLFLSALFVLALALPAQASANVVAMEPSAPTATAMGQAIMADPSQLAGASLPEAAFSELEPTLWPVGIGTNEAPAPIGLTGFPTAGSSFGILSTGDVHTIGTTLANESESTSGEFGHETAGSRGSNAYDWTTLKLDVQVPSGDNCLALDYRFLSEEFPEFVGTEFNDAFIAEVDNSTWSVAGEGELSRPNDFASSLEGTPISVNGVGPAAVTPQEAEGTYFDAATGLITTKFPISAGAHSIYLSVFDASDERYDSAVFLDNLRFINEDPSTCRPPTSAELQAPPAGSPPPPAPPSNEFSFGPKVKFKNGGTQATIVVNVPGPGTVSAAQQGATASASAARASASVTGLKAKGKKKALIVPTSVTATAAGPVKLTVKLTGPAKKVLAKKRKLTVSVAITYTPTGGSAKTESKTLIFKKPAKHGKHKKH